MVRKNEERYLQMIEDRKSGMTLEAIAQKHGVCRTRVSQILGRYHVTNFQPVQDCPYPNLAKWMNENQISRSELTQRLYGNGSSNNVYRVREYISGRLDPPKRFIDKLLKVAGMSYEVMFAKEENHD